MNERIKELAKEAAREMNETGTYSEPKFQEKFAELIVRECSKINNQFNGYRIGEIDLDIVYKEHFGVEE
jgi:hypothetical protein